MKEQYLWKGDELIVMQEYGFRCVLCGFKFAVALHHEPPKSLNPNWKDEPWTQYPLCAADHDLIQDMPRVDAADMLDRYVNLLFPGAPERIKEKINAAVER